MLMAGFAQGVHNSIANLAADDAEINRTTRNIDPKEDLEHIAKVAKILKKRQRLGGFRDRLNRSDRLANDFARFARTSRGFNAQRRRDAHLSLDHQVVHPIFNQVAIGKIDVGA